MKTVLIGFGLVVAGGILTVLLAAAWYFIDYLRNGQQGGGS